MGFCRSALCGLIFLLCLHGVVCGSAPPHSNVTVDLNDPATLPCSGSSGKVPWKVKWIQNSDYHVASCNQTSCWSEHGFEISHDQYLKGNFSLNVTAVDHNDTGSYVCRSENHILSTALLQIRESEISTLDRSQANLREQVLPGLPTMKVNLHDPAVLPCFNNCSGVASWRVGSKQSGPLAECDQTSPSCRSVKGYQMIYNQYRQGNISLIITDVDFSKRGTYTCMCDGTDLNDTKLLVNTVNSTVQKTPGETLVLELEVSESVKVYYNGTEVYSVGQVCSEEELSPDDKPKHMHRSLRPSVELMNISLSDSGVYVVRDTRNNEDIRIYNINITDEQTSPCKDLHYSVSREVFIGSLVAAIVLTFIVTLLLVKVYRRKRPCCVKACITMNPVQRNEDGREMTEQDAILPPGQQQARTDYYSQFSSV